MDEMQHLLVKLAEEAAELSQAASKAALFGLDDVYEGKTTAQRICEELIDVRAVALMLKEQGFETLPTGFDLKLADIKALHAKADKVEIWMRHSRAQGMLK